MRGFHIPPYPPFAHAIRGGEAPSLFLNGRSRLARGHASHRQLHESATHRRDGGGP